MREKIFILKRFFLFFIFALLLSAAACAPAAKDPRQMLIDALRKTEAYESYDMAGTIKTKFVTADNEHEMNTTMSGTFFRAPLKAKIEITIENAERDTKTTSEMYVEESDGVYTMYVNVGDYGFLYETVINEADAKSVGMDGSDTLKLFMDNSLSVSSIAHEEMLGTVTDTIEIIAPPTIFTQAGADVLPDDFLLPDDFANMGDLGYDVSITKDGVSRLYMNLGGNLKALGNAILKNPDATAEMKELAEFYKSSELITEFNYTNINKAEDFIIPKEAKK